MRVKFAVLSFALMVILSSCGRSNDCYQGSTDPNCPVSYGGTSQYGNQGYGNGYDSYGGDYSSGGYQQQGYNQGYSQQQGYGNQYQYGY